MLLLSTAEEKPNSAPCIICETHLFVPVAQVGTACYLLSGISHPAGSSSSFSCHNTGYHGFILVVVIVALLKLCHLMFTYNLVIMALSAAGKQLRCACCSALTCKAAVDAALAEIEAQREAHSQKERDLQIQSQASKQAAEQIPSMRSPFQPQQPTLALFFILFATHLVAQALQSVQAKCVLIEQPACKYQRTASVVF